MLRLPSHELRDLQGRTAPMSLRGQITVSPPKGTCFEVERREDEPDERVCHKTRLGFALGDLDKAGHLHWSVKTGDGDFGTALVWNTPYRAAILTMPDAKPEDPPVYRLLGECTALVSPTSGRRIEIELLNGGHWTIHFPAQDTLTAQPPKVPKLYLDAISGKVGLPPEVNANSDAKGQAEPAEAAKKGEADAAAKPTLPPKPKPVAADQEDDRKVWAIPARASYVMSADNFVAFGSVTPGLKGTCRYHYGGPPDDPGTGRLECHGVEGFKSVYLPLTCLSRVKPR